MATLARLLPAALALLMLAAHFYRHRQLLPAVVSLALLAALGVPRPGAVRAVQIALVAGVVVWLRTAWAFAEARRAMHTPTLRLWLILGGVAAFTALAAWLLEGRARALDARLTLESAG